MKKIRIPHTYTLLFIIIVVIALSTWIIPSGQFKTESKAGKTVPIAGTYQTMDKVSTANGKTVDVRQGLKGVLMAPIKGGEAAASVLVFVLIIGGSFGIISKSGAIEAGLAKSVRSLSGKELFIIPVTMLLFGLGGTTFGMCEETIPFYMVFIPLMLSLGYDSITGFMIVSLGAATGTAASTTNPFSVGIAQGLSEIAPGSGVDFRWVQWVILMTIAIAFVMWYANRVKKDPTKSPVYESDKQNKEFFLKNMGDADKKEFKWNHAVILLAFGFMIFLLIYGVKKWDWYIEEISMLFFGMGLFAGVITMIAEKIGEKEIAESFVQGCKDLTYAAVVIGLARGILVVAQDGKIIDTILNSLATSLNGLPKTIFTTLMLAFQNLIAILVPSSSGHAALTMPVMAPLGDLVNVNRQVVVTAYQYGTGLTNMLTPTSGTLMAALGIARIPYGKWLKHILPLVAVFWILAVIFLIVGLSIYPV